jgi:hypothetical protein
MNTTMRNLTLTAAALAALTVIAPKAAAQPWKGFPLPPSPHQVREMFQERHGSPRNQAPGHAYGNYGRGSNGGGYGHESYGTYGHGGYGHGGYGGYRGAYGYRYVAPVRPYVRYGYGAAPYRLYSGFRFYSACPGPGYVYIADLGWVLPPFLGAVWVPGHYDIGGYWVDGFWQ